MISFIKFRPLWRLQTLTIVSVLSLSFLHPAQKELPFSGNVTADDTIPQTEISKLKRKDIYVVIFDNEIAKIRVKSGDSIVMGVKDFNALPPTIQKELSANGDGLFTNEQIESKFPGGQPSWSMYLMRNLKYPPEAFNNNISGTVVVQFIISDKGKVSKVEAVSGPISGGLREEAVRVIEASGKWVPAIWNGYKVTSYKKQPLSFNRE